MRFTLYELARALPVHANSHAGTIPTLGGLPPWPQYTPLVFDNLDLCASVVINPRLIVEEFKRVKTLGLCEPPIIV